MIHNSYNIVELPIINSNGRTSLLFGKWTLEGINLKFEGVTIEDGLVKNEFRDVINHTLLPNTLAIGNTFEINKRTYEVVVHWFLQLLEDTYKCIDEIPESDDKEQALVIITDKQIIITPYGKELTDDDFERSIIDDNLPQLEIYLPTSYSDFPDIRKVLGCNNLDFYWEAIKNGKAKYISYTMCDMLICTITQKLNAVIQQIRYIHSHKSLYK